MVGPWPHRAFTFRALSKTYGQMWLRCDVCRRYARLNLAGLHDVDYRTKTFSCSRCGGEAYFCLVEPITEYGMADYRLDEVEKPERHLEAVKRLTEPPRRPISSRGDELPRPQVQWSALSRFLFVRPDHNRIVWSRLLYLERVVYRHATQPLVWCHQHDGADLDRRLGLGVGRSGSAIERPRR
jgi:hypothetical protein